jgi:hypothetical protein
MMLFIRTLFIFLSLCFAGVAQASDSEFCAALVANQKQRGELQFLQPETTTEEKTSLVHERLIENNNGRVYFDFIEHIYRADIDNDGQPENIALSIQGSAKGKELVIYDDQWKFKSYEWKGFDFEDDYVRWAEESSLIRFRGKTYILAWDSTGQFMRYASIIENGIHRMICKIGYEDRPVVSIVSAKDSALCRAVLAGNLQYARFDGPSVLAAGSASCYKSGGPSCAQSSESSAFIDIDNDGKPERVVELGVAWGGGAGCDFKFLALPAPDGKRLLTEGIGKVLMDATTKWGTCGGAVSRPFRHRGTWYIENKYSPERIFGYHHVVRIQKSRAEKVCEFSVTQTPYVM